jgi:hypothetical protein
MPVFLSYAHRSIALLLGESINWASFNWGRILFAKLNLHVGLKEGGIIAKNIRTVYSDLYGHEAMADEMGRSWSTRGSLGGRCEQKYHLRDTGAVVNTILKKWDVSVWIWFVWVM